MESLQENEDEKKTPIGKPRGKKADKALPDMSAMIPGKKEALALLQKKSQQ